jgi:hypothetical protein
LRFVTFVTPTTISPINVCDTNFRGYVLLILAAGSTTLNRFDVSAMSKCISL